MCPRSEGPGAALVVAASTADWRSELLDASSDLISQDTLDGWVWDMVPPDLTCPECAQRIRSLYPRLEDDEIGLLPVEREELDPIVPDDPPRCHICNALPLPP